MDTYCECTWDGEGQVFDIRMPIARKQHICIECNKKIFPGENYERVVGKWEGMFDSISTCKICAAIRRDFAPCSCFGELDEILREQLGFEQNEIR